MGLDDPAYDEVVPVVVVAHFATEFIRGFCNIMRAVVPGLPAGTLEVAGPEKKNR